MGELSLRECINEKMEDIESVLKQMVEMIVLGKDRVGTESLSTLASLYNENQTQLRGLLDRVADHQARHDQIVRLQQAVAERDATIEQMEQCLKETETSLMNAVFQAHHKLKSIAQSEAQKVNSEQLIRFAHRISRTNAVAAPLTWQQGDDQRPYPTQFELSKGALAVDRRPPAPTALALLRQQQSQHSSHMMMRPSTSGAPRASPSQHYSAITTQRAWSPRQFAPRTPRGGGVTTPSGGAMRQTISSPARVALPSSVLGAPRRPLQSPRMVSPSSYGPSPPKQACPPPPVRDIAAMSSDSSSSSSGSEESPY